MQSRCVEGRSGGGCCRQATAAAAAKLGSANSAQSTTHTYRVVHTQAGNTKRLDVSSLLKVNSARHCNDVTCLENTHNLEGNYDTLKLQIATLPTQEVNATLAKICLAFQLFVK